MRRHGIEPAVLSTPEALISLDAVAALLEEAATLTGAEDFGLRHGSSQSIGVVGPLAVALRNATTPQQALAFATRYLFLHSPAYEAVLEHPSPVDSACSVVRIGVHLPGAAPQRQLMEGILASAWSMGRSLSAGRLNLTEVWIPHGPLSPERRYREVFGCRITFDAPFAGLHARSKAFTASIADVQPALRSAALRYLAAQDRPEDSSSDRVRQVMRRLEGAGYGARNEVAAALALHPRTLQRRLSAEGTSFDALRDEVQRDALLHHLRDTDIPLAQLAPTLGYADQAAMTRATKRWLCDTPARLRKQYR